MFSRKNIRDEKSIDPKIKSIQLNHRDLVLTYCTNPNEFLPLLTPDVKKKSFPPDGMPEITELDHFFSITRKGNFVGFFRVVDLHFYGEVQLHGSYNDETSFAIRSYFELGKIFIQAIKRLFPRKIISSTALRTNGPVLRFLDYLEFVRIGTLEENDNYFYYRKF